MHRNFVKSGRLVWTLLALMGWLGAPARSHAALVVDIQSVTIPQGGTGTVTVSVSSTTGTDSLYAFGFHFVITPHQASALEFQSPQNYSELSVPGYVFASTGSANLTGPSSGVVGPATEYVNLDTSDDFTNGAIVPTAPFQSILAILDITTLTGTPPSLGDIFTISLDQSSADTFFWDPATNDIPFTANSGTVTIGATSAVPEPSSLILAMTALGGFAWLHRKQKRSVAPASYQ